MTPRTVRRARLSGDVRRSGGGGAVNQLKVRAPTTAQPRDTTHSLSNLVLNTLRAGHALPPIDPAPPARPAARPAETPSSSALRGRVPHLIQNCIRRPFVPIKRNNDTYIIVESQAAEAPSAAAGRAPLYRFKV